LSELDLFPLTPDYPVARRMLAGVVESSAESGRRFARLKRAPRVVHELNLRARPTAEKLALEEFYRAHEKGYFSFRDPVFAVDPATGQFLERWFSVEFAAAPVYELVGHEAWDLEVALVDRVGAPLFSYPDPAAGHRSVFLEETAGLALAGAWTSAANPLAHGGGERSNLNTITADAFQWVYAGYGFVLWSRRAPDFGLVEVLLDATALGTADLYAAAARAAAPVFTKLDVPLGLHRVQLRATNTKNAAAAGQAILADALEILI
jgi:hypothetical protein